jgi:Protein of unknown function (DUF1064)
MTLRGQWRGWKNLDPDTKYGNTPMRCRLNQLHQSKLEARRCDELQILLAAGEIRELKAHPQPVYPLVVNGRKVTTYRGDFEYLDRDGNTVTEDTKGMRTDVFALKAELFAALYDREIVELKRARGRR